MSHEDSDNEARKIHFSDDELNEEEYDDKLCLEPRPKKKKKNRKGSNVEKMIDLLSAMDKKKWRRTKRNEIGKTETPWRKD